jgi:hypothetical protein
MRWLDLALLAVYLLAFVWYGRLSYVRGVLDRHWTPETPSVQKVLHAGDRPAKPRQVHGAGR